VSEGRPNPKPDDEVIIELVPVVRQIVASRSSDPQVVDDLVQETIARVMAARSRVHGDTLAPYAAVTARNLVASMARRNGRASAKSHLLVDPGASEPPGESLLRQEQSAMMASALARLPAEERDLILAHEVQHQDTRTLAAGRSSTPGAVAAQLSRIRAKLRVEYLLVCEQLEPPSDRCRPVLRAISAGDKRRQRELDAGAHLLECDCCSRVSTLLLDRRPATSREEVVRVPISKDADVVTACQKGREAALELGFSSTELTLIATAISEIARNIVRFAERGDMVISRIAEDGRVGVNVLARDVGPGIPRLAAAMLDGYSTYAGLGLGLPGAKRLMDEFDIVTELGKGTTVTMTKWTRRVGDDMVKHLHDRQQQGDARE
jgi:RNA polymerase sigma factor (sigma-70 family)